MSPWSWAFEIKERRDLIADKITEFIEIKPHHKWKIRVPPGYKERLRGDSFCFRQKSKSQIPNLMRFDKSYIDKQNDYSA